MWAVQNRMSDVPDRLPFEIADRLTAGPPAIQRYREPDSPVLVVASKKSGTVRPFVRLSPEDLHLYQALVDRLAPVIEVGIAPRTKVFGYRQTTEGEDDPFAGSPGWRDFQESARLLTESSNGSHVLKADISGFYMNIDHDFLVGSLKDLGADPLLAGDLAALLNSWKKSGIHGLPQGVPASGPLANAYLATLDELLADQMYIRYMDDFYVFTGSYDECRKLQDAIEQKLYSAGLTLSSEKTRILKSSTLRKQLPTAGEKLDAEAEGRMDAIQDLLYETQWDEYGPADEMPEPAEVEESVLEDALDLALEQIESGEVTSETQPALIECFRRLGRSKNDRALMSIAPVINRFPGIIRHALFYAAEFAASNEEAVEAAFADAIEGERFHRDQEWIQISAAALQLPEKFSVPVASRFGEISEEGDHPTLVRARALLAWGMHSPMDDFERSMNFWRTADSKWRHYAVVAIQSKDRSARDQQFNLWAAADEELRPLIEMVRQEKIGWRKL